MVTCQHWLHVSTSFFFLPSHLSDALKVLVQQKIFQFFKKLSKISPNKEMFAKLVSHSVLVAMAAVFSTCKKYKTGLERKMGDCF